MTARREKRRAVWNSEREGERGETNRVRRPVETEGVQEIERRRARTGQIRRSSSSTSGRIPTIPRESEHKRSEEEE